MEINLPGNAYPYIRKTEQDVLHAIDAGDVLDYGRQWERYSKAWARVWQLMAKEHFNSRDILEVDMRYFRHLPDGYSFVMDSSVLGCKFLVLPRKPRVAPKNMKYITASEMIKVHGCPVILELMKSLGAWFDRKERTTGLEMEKLVEASKRRAQRILAAGDGLRLKATKKGVDYYE